MARISSIPLNPPSNFYSGTTTLKPWKPINHSSFFLRLSKISTPTPGTCALRVTRIAVARYGGGGGYRPGGGSGGGGYRPGGGSGGGSRRSKRDNRIADPDYDPALDMDKITSNSVRLLDVQQNMIGVVSKNEAIRMAEDEDLVLAILSPDADPPVLRLFDSMEFKKFKYEQQKKKRVQLKRSSANRMDLKELKMGYNIDTHDYSVRLRAAQKFLKDGDKVKIIVNLKGRENEFRNIAIELLKRFQNEIGELATEESKNFSDRNMFIVLTPNKTVIQKVQEQPKKKVASVSEVSASV